MPKITINGCSLYYEVRGSGIPCLVMHGGLGHDHHYFLPSFRALEADYRFIFYDHRGNGGSDAVPRAAITHAQLVADARGLMEGLGFRRYSILGHSYGGFIALEFALRYPDLLDSLILVSTSPGKLSFEGIIDKARKRGATEAMLLALQRDNAGDDDFREDWFTILPLYFHRMRPEFARPFDAVVTRLAGMAPIEEMRKYDLTGSLGMIRDECLVIHGDDDFLFPPETQEILLNGIPRSTPALIRDCGHYPFIEREDAFRTAMVAWKKRLTSAQPA